MNPGVQPGIEFDITGTGIHGHARALGQNRIARVRRGIVVIPNQPSGVGHPPAVLPELMDGTDAIRMIYVVAESKRDHFSTAIAALKVVSIADVNVEIAVLEIERELFGTRWAVAIQPRAFLVVDGIDDRRKALTEERAPVIEIP